MNIRFLGIACTVLMLAGPAFAHHGFAIFDYNKEVTIVGEVKELQWTNPHIHLLVNVPNGRGGATEWDVEAGTPGSMRSAGWSRDVVKPGEKISVVIHPMKSGANGGQLVRARRGDGTPIGGPYYTLAQYGLESGRARTGRNGGGLAGELVATPVTEWSFTDSVEVIQLQTRTPYLIPPLLSPRAITRR